MTYRTILLHLSCDAGHLARIEAAVDLAVRFKAHISVLFIANPVGMPAAIEGRGASAAFVEEATEIARERSAKINEECRKRFEAAGLTCDWTMAEGDHLDLLAAAAPYVDLAIVSHSKAELIEDRVVFHVPEHLPLVVGCPVVVLPAEGFNPPVGKRVLIAWKPTTEAARAVNLALPLLHEATEVTILTVLSEAETDSPADRHGIKARVVTDTSGTQYTGEAIIAKAQEIGADAMVMGAYGHSRLREMVLGGVTRHVLMNAKVPMLLAH